MKTHPAQAPMESLIRQMIEKSNPENRCFLIIDNKFYFPQDIERYFTAALTSQMLFRIMQTFVRKDIFTDSNFELYQSIRTLITRKDLETEKKEFLKKFQTMLLEMGHPTHFRRDLPDVFSMELAPIGDKEAPRIYWSLQQYISENTRVQGLTFNQLDLLARLYFGLVIAILLANLAHRLLLRLSMRTSIRAAHIGVRTKNHFGPVGGFNRRSLLTKQRLNKPSGPKATFHNRKFRFEPVKYRPPTLSNDRCIRMQGFENLARDRQILSVLKPTPFN